MQRKAIPSPFGGLRPQLEDGPAQIKQRSRGVIRGLWILALSAPAVCLPRMSGALGDVGYWSALAVIVLLAAPLVAYLGLLTLHAARLRSNQEALTERDLDRVVDYAHRLGVSDQARSRLKGPQSCSLTYSMIDNFLDWMEQQALLIRAKGPQSF